MIGKRTHIDNQIVVAETAAALRQKDLRVSRLAAFLHRVPHVPGRNELSFLDVHWPTAQGGGDHQIGLAAQKRGNLQHVDNFRNLGHVRHFVHIGQHRNLKFIFNFFQNAQAFLHAGPAKAANRSAVGFVVAGFEDEREIRAPCVTPLMISAMRMACSSLSITHGPAIRKRSPEPMRTSPSWKEESKVAKTFNHRAHRERREKSQIQFALLSRCLGDLGGELFLSTAA